MRSSLVLLYLVAGGVVAGMHGYFDEAQTDTLRQLAEAAVAVLIWPFILVGVEVNLK